MDPISSARALGLSIVRSWTSATASIVGITLPTAPPLAQTPRDVIALEGGARLLHFHRPAGVAPVGVTGGHVGACVGSRAVREMYPALIRWLAPDLRDVI